MERHLKNHEVIDVISIDIEGLCAGHSPISIQCITPKLFLTPISKRTTYASDITVDGRASNEALPSFAIVIQLFSRLYPLRAQSCAIRKGGKSVLPRPAVNEFSECLVSVRG